MAGRAGSVKAWSISACPCSFDYAGSRLVGCSQAQILPVLIYSLSKFDLNPTSLCVLKPDSSCGSAKSAKIIFISLLGFVGRGGCGSQGEHMLCL